MQLGLAIAVALLILGVVAWPLVARRRRQNDATTEPAPADTTPASATALEDVYEAIRTLQMEHSLGRVSDTDFREQLDEYRRQAAVILRDMDRESGEERDG